MARPRKFVNTSDYPDFVIELMARTFYEDMLCDILKDKLSLPEIHSSINDMCRL